MPVPFHLDSEYSSNSSCRSRNHLAIHILLGTSHVVREWLSGPFYHQQLTDRTGGHLQNVSDSRLLGVFMTVS